ncbi:DUF1674 domain-containing protein [Arenicella chitinivorans]|nr:succinate dehydrogenase assembly factor 4 [Arenicella chitinivorans]
MSDKKIETSLQDAESQTQEQELTKASEPNGTKPQEINGPRGPEPTRYGDWESKGRCVDF